MFRLMSDFVKAYDGTVQATEAVFRALTDKSLSQQVTDDHRTLGRIAWHIVTTVPEMMRRTGIALSSIDEASQVPGTAGEILDVYRKVTEEFRTVVSEKWTDETMAQVDNMYGQQWPRGLTLSILISHEIHHRGQMTVLMRQAGCTVPGVMGPAKEEWAQMGMEPPKI
jgi:uncharacterized damage-inducible protein DinB